MKFYRYRIVPEPSLGNLHLSDLECIEFSLIKETPKGYWISQYGVANGLHSPKKWVSKTSRKRYAYPTRIEAIKSFMIRANRRIDYLKRDLDHTEMALVIATTELEKIK